MLSLPGRDVKGRRRGPVRAVRRWRVRARRRLVVLPHVQLAARDAEEQLVDVLRRVRRKLLLVGGRRRRLHRGAVPGVLLGLPRPVLESDQVASTLAVFKVSRIEDYQTGSRRRRGFEVDYPPDDRQYASPRISQNTRTGEDGHDCSDPGLTVASLKLEVGYWRASTASATVYACPFKDNCGGGASVDGDALCRRHSEGPLLRF